MVRERRDGIEAQKKEVLKDNRRMGEEAGVHGWGFLDARPSEIDIEEEEEDTQTDNGALHRHPVSLVIILTWNINPHRIGHHLSPAD